MKILRKIVKSVILMLAVLLTYFIIAFILTYIPVNSNTVSSEDDKIVYLNSNGIHLDIILPKSVISDMSPLQEVVKGIDDNYISLGWGDENFYLNTPEWSDLTIQNALQALFLNSHSLLHITRYPMKRETWLKVALSQSQLNKLLQFISNTFIQDVNGHLQILIGNGYGANDDFYRAKGSYSIFNTCNTWVNSAFKKSGLKACLWTPFDFGLMDKYAE